MENITMKFYKNIKIISLASFALLIFMTPVTASDDVLTQESIDIINERVGSMNYRELVTAQSSLRNELQDAEQSVENTQSPSSNKALRTRIAEINAELSAIQKALVAMVAVGAVSALTDDGYNDDVPPVITVLGDNPATVELGSTYVDAGATAMDAFHGDTNVVSSGTVDTSAVGTYTITYSATDLDNNTATASRTVNVVDTTSPVITLTGDASVTVELGSTYTDAGATATDASGAITVTSSGTVDTTTVGSYTITYSATDASGNAATQVTRTVTVVDTTAPTVVVTGDNPATVELGTSYTDEGATATDASGTVTVVTTGTVDVDTLGSYTITYTSTDASNNSGTATRVVNVVDTTVPVFTSSSTFVIDEGDTDVGTVTATDIQAVTFSIVSDVLSITSDGVLTIDSAASDYEAQSDNPVTLPYDGSTYDITATVIATDASSNAAT
jgi:hypothetical protein